MENTDYINNYFKEMNEITETIDKNEISKAINILFEAWKNNNNIYFIGCGGSSGTASHFAADLAKTTIVPGKKRFKSLSLVDNPSLLTAWVNDSGWESVFMEQIKNFINPGDVVVALSVHGGKGKGDAGSWSQNLTLALQYVKDNNGKCIGLAGFDGGAFKEICDACIIVKKDSTPLVEGFHSDLQHLIIFRLKELISEYEDQEVKKE